MGIFNKLFKSKEERERLKELEENKKRALNEYKYQLKELKNSGKITKNNYSKKLASFEQLINMEAERKNKLLNQSYELNQKKYNNLLNNTRLFRTKKAETFSEKNNIKVFNTPSEKVNTSIDKQNSSQQNSTVVGNIQTQKKPFRVVPQIKNEQLKKLIEELPQSYTKIYTNEKEYLERKKNNEKIKKFINHIKNSFIKNNNYENINKVDEIIKKYNKNTKLSPENEKTMKKYIAHKYYKF